MAFMHRVSGWLGRLSVGRKLMLIYLLDLTAVIYVSGILIHEKYLAIDFARKEMVGTEYVEVVRDGLLQGFLPLHFLPVLQCLLSSRSQPKMPRSLPAQGKLPLTFSFSVPPHNHFLRFNACKR